MNARRQNNEMKGSGTANPDGTTVADMKTGQTCRIIKVATHDQAKLRKLMAFGILPGAEIKVMQRFPSYVICIGHTQVAIDKEIASEIVVN